jgi:hypothetical protein
VQALQDGGLRREAATDNRDFVEAHGLLDTNMARLEAWYRRLARRER